MKINIASTHRFHLLDLARELEKQGHDVKFYSYVPQKDVSNLGLIKKLPFFHMDSLTFSFIRKNITPIH